MSWEDPTLARTVPISIGESVRGRSKNDNRDRKGGQILLKGQVVIDSDECLKLPGGERKQFPVLDR